VDEAGERLYRRSVRRKRERRVLDALDPDRRRPEPEGRERESASAIGNRALSNLITTGSVRRTARGIERSSAPRVIARDPPKQAPTKPDPPAKKVDFPEADKERARKMVIGPLRAAAEKLGVGEKADIAWVLRHLKPIPTAMDGVNWPDDPATMKAASDALEDFDNLLTVLKSMKLDHRHAVSGALHRWHSAKRSLEEAKNAVEAGVKETDHRKEPPRSGAVSDINALSALEQEIDAVCEDLAKAPHSQEGMKDVAKTAGDLLGQFDTVQPGEAGGVVEHAKAEFESGLATIIPLAEGKAETIKQAQKMIVEMANKLAAVLGDAPPAGDPSAPDDDPPVQVPPPGALPPPKPPGGTSPTPRPPKTK
jgi:hypothetical protein